MDQAAITTLLTSLAAATGTAIAVLFKRLVTLNDRTAENNRKIGLLEGRQEGIARLSAEVLETVHRATSQRDQP